MISKKESLVSRRLGRTRRSLRRNRGGRGTSHPFSETFLKDSHILESIEWMR
jgi:hypothetical protein